MLIVSAECNRRRKLPPWEVIGSVYGYNIALRFFWEISDCVQELLLSVDAPEAGYNSHVQ